MKEKAVKPATYKNKAILRAAEGEACTHCKAQTDTVVAAHSNLLEDGKGVGKKSHDYAVAFLCYKCHQDYDLKIKIAEGRLRLSQEDFHRAMKLTWLRLLQKKVLQ